MTRGSRHVISKDRPRFSLRMNRAGDSKFSVHLILYEWQTQCCGRPRNPSPSSAARRSSGSSLKRTPVGQSLLSRAHNEPTSEAAHVPKLLITVRSLWPRFLVSAIPKCTAFLVLYTNGNRLSETTRN